MSYLLFPAYLLMFSSLLYFLSAKNYIRVNRNTAVASFLLKVTLGCFYGYIFLHYYHGDDTWKYYFQSLDETALLKSDPLRFFTSLFDLNNETRYSSLFESVGSFWKELEYVLLIKLIAIFNVFSGNEYYINVIWFSFLSFWGGYYFYRLFSSVFPKYEKSMALVFFFFIPLVFWTSGIRKDGLILLFMALIFYHFYFFLKSGQWKRLIVILISLFMLFLIRSFLTLTIIPALIAWWIAEKYRIASWKVFLAVYGFCLVLFFVSARVGPVNFPQKISERQQDFFRLKGGSEVQLDSLGTDFSDYLKILPQAANHVFIRPYPGETSSLLYKFSMLESWGMVIMFILAVVYPATDLRKIIATPIVLTLIFYGLSNYLLIGYTIPFLGAIVRYRIIFETLFLAIIIRCTGWNKIPLLKSYIKFK